MRYLVAVAALSLALAGCVSTDVTPLAKNVYKLNADGRGALGGRESATRKALIKEAAELTLQKGYTHFVIDGTQSESSRTLLGSTPTRANTFGSATIQQTNRYGLPRARISGQSQTTVYGGSPIYSRQASSSAIVIMFEAADPRSENAVDAAEFLASL